MNQTSIGLMSTEANNSAMDSATGVMGALKGSDSIRNICMISEFTGVFMNAISRVQAVSGLIKSAHQTIAPAIQDRAEAPAEITAVMTASRAAFEEVVRELDREFIELFGCSLIAQAGAGQMVAGEASAQVRKAEQAAPVAQGVIRAEVAVLAGEGERVGQTTEENKPLPAYLAAYKNPPKYMDPVTGALWGGRGPVPKWMKPLLEAGASKEDFLIEKVKAAKAAQASEGAKDAQTEQTGKSEAEADARGAEEPVAQEFTSGAAAAAEVEPVDSGDEGTKSFEVPVVTEGGSDASLDSMNEALDGLMGRDASAPVQQDAGLGAALDEVLAAVDENFEAGTVDAQADEQDVGSFTF